MMEDRKQENIEDEALELARRMKSADRKPAGRTRLQHRGKRFSLPRGSERAHLYDLVYRIGITLICVAELALMLPLAADSSLWLDEIFQVDYCRSSTLAQIIVIDPYTPPLYNIIAWFWYRAVPYGEIWLRLPSVLFVVASLPLMAAAGRRIGGRRTGFLTAFLLLINAKVCTQLALSFRSYALLLLLASLLIYLYVRRMQTPAEASSWRMAAAYEATMLALGYTHYFGILLACAFFAVDLVALARGRLQGRRLKTFLPYAFAVAGYLPWIPIALGTLIGARTRIATGMTVDHWQNDPNLHNLLYWLCGECAETLGLFHIALIIIFVVAVYRCLRKQFDWEHGLPLIALACAVIGVTGAIWAYCAHVNPSSMLWVERYFTPLIPAIALISAWGACKIFSWIPVNDPMRFIAAFLCVALLIPTTMGTVQNDMAEGSSTRFYAKLAEWLEQRSDISSDKTLVLALINTTDRGRQTSAWKHYYFDLKDTRDFKVNILEGLDTAAQLNPYDLLAYDTVYVTCQHFDPEIPDTYAEVFQRYYKKHRTGNPGGGTTVYYTKR